MSSPELYSESYYRTLKQEYLADSPWKRNRIANVMQLIEDLQLNSRKALDIACGIGTFTVELHNRKAFTVGIDSSATAIIVSSLLFRETVLASGNFLASDALMLPFAGDSFDLVMCADFIEHITGKDYRRLLDESWRILKPGGHICVYTPNRWHFLELMMRSNFILKRDDSHIDIKTLGGTTEPLKKAGFEIVRKYYRPTHVKLLKLIESLFMYLPVAGQLFRRRICVLARKPHA